MLTATKGPLVHNNMFVPLSITFYFRHLAGSTSWRGQRLVVPLNNSLPLFTNDNHSQGPAPGYRQSSSECLKNWRFVVLKWSWCSPNPCSMNLLYLFNENECYRPPGWWLEGMAFSRVVWHKPQGLWVNTPHDICVHFHLAKVSECILHLLATCSRDFMQ